MPKGTPTPDQVWNKEISFFSIDTDVIQGAGYNFEEGQLNQLHKQLPSTMELQLTDIVANEVVKHLMVPVKKSIDALKAATASLKRRADLPVEKISELFSELRPEESSRKHFQSKIESYAKGCRGGILATEGESILNELFRRYFAVEPPFEVKVAKKSEFPDAAALLVLESYAIDQNSKGIVVSKDGGWQRFATQSDHLYCVQSVDELTELFKATGDVPNQITASILKTINDPSSNLRNQLNQHISKHIENSIWDVGDIYTNVGYRINGDIADVSFKDQDVSINDPSIWEDEDNPSTWIIEITVFVKIDATVSTVVYFWDSIDREEVKGGYAHIDREDEIQIAAFLSCSNVQAGSTPETWEVQVEIADAEYTIEVGEVNAFSWSDRDHREYY